MDFDESIWYDLISSDGSIITGPNEHSFNISLESGVYDIHLITLTNYGCISNYNELEFITVNNFQASISSAPDAICFNGLESVTETFSSTITGDVSDLPYNVIS